MSLCFAPNQRKCSDEHDPVSKRFNRRQNKSNLNQEAVSPANGSSCSGQKTYRQAAEQLANPAAYRLPLATRANTPSKQSKPESAFNSGAKTKGCWTRPCALPVRLRIASKIKSTAYPGHCRVRRGHRENNAAVFMNQHGLQITASPHLVQARSGRLIFRLQQGMRPHELL